MLFFQVFSPYTIILLSLYLLSFGPICPAAAVERDGFHLDWRWLCLILQLLLASLVSLVSLALLERSHRHRCEVSLNSCQCIKCLLFAHCSAQLFMSNYRSNFVTEWPSTLVIRVGQEARRS